MTNFKNYSIMLFKHITLLLPAVFIFTSCKKDSPDIDTASSIAGKWAGMRGDGVQPATYDFRFTIRAGGVMDVTNASGAVKGSGTWILNGTEFTAQYLFAAPLFTKYRVKATYNKSNGKLNGVWGFDDGLMMKVPGIWTSCNDHTEVQS